MKIKKAYRLISIAELERRWDKLRHAYLNHHSAMLFNKMTWQTQHALLRHLKAFRDILNAQIEEMEEN